MESSLHRTPSLGQLVLNLVNLVVALSHKQEQRGREGERGGGRGRDQVKIRNIMKIYSFH